jgi:hypothetical protein
MSDRVMNPVLFWLCWLTALLLDWIPGYCRHYTVQTPPAPVPAHWVPRFGDMTRHWSWRWRGEWGFRLLAKLDLIDDFTDECQRRFEDRNPSSGS